VFAAVAGGCDHGPPRLKASRHMVVLRPTAMADRQGAAAEELGIAESTLSIEFVDHG
jgi:hypothetical protein